MNYLVKVLVAVLFTFGLSQSADAQQRGKVTRIGTLLSGSPTTHGHNLKWFREGLHNLGYIEGRDYVLISRWGMGKRKRLPELAKELVAAKVDVILTSGGASIRASGRATRSIPIVAGSAGNLGGYGFVDSFSKPGGNVTGSTFKGSVLNLKRLGVLKETLPKAQHIVFLMAHSSKRFRRDLKRMKTGGKKLGLKIQVLKAKKIATIKRTFESNGDPDALIINIGPEFNSQRQALAAFAIERKIPTMCQQEAYAEAGCLISYTVDRQRMWHRAASFVDRILKGANPAELPVELATRYKLVVNLKTAKLLQLKIPRSILLQATRVIE
jgi:putative ABC transport system substrate-binding protein